MWTCQIVWRLRHRTLLRTAKETGKSVDELLVEQGQEQGKQEHIVVDNNSNSNHEEETSSSAINAPLDQAVQDKQPMREDADIERGPDQ